MPVGAVAKRERGSIPLSSYASGRSWAVGPRDGPERRSEERGSEANDDLQTREAWHVLDSLSICGPLRSRIGPHIQQDSCSRGRTTKATRARRKVESN